MSAPEASDAGPSTASPGTRYALVSFGLDSTIEVSAALVALWYLRGEDDERGERAGRLIALSFWALAAWVTFDAVGDLATGDRPDVSAVGIVLTAVSALVVAAIALREGLEAWRGELLEEGGCC